MRPEVASPRRVTLSTLHVALAVWTVFGLVCATSVFWSMRTHGHSPPRLFSYHMLVWYGWALATPVVAWLGRRLPLVPFSWGAAVGHVALSIGFGLAHHVWWTVLLVTMRPYDVMQKGGFADVIGNDVSNRLFFESTIYFAVLGVAYAVDYQRRLRERELRAAQLEASLAQAKLTALELQLQPHFLFNTLHAIGGLVRQSRGPEAVEMIAGLSDLLRYSLDHAGKHVVPLEKEVAIAGRYLEIQRLRFSDRLAVKLDVPRETHRVRVPALILQPLVENAVRHGIERANESGSIVVRARRDGANLVLAVVNTGAELGDVADGIGIANTRARLEQLYAGRHTFALKSEGRHVIATVTLPFEEEPA
jgi:hypothetical protein